MERRREGCSVLSLVIVLSATVTLCCGASIKIVNSVRNNAAYGGGGSNEQKNQGKKPLDSYPHLTPAVARAEYAGPLPLRALQGVCSSFVSDR
jgi:hypothetical protein